jgi:RNA polymerase sigma factor (sigma-70 family)
MTALATTPLTQTKPNTQPTSERRADVARGHALVLLRGGNQPVPDSLDATATALMDEYRRTRSREVFDVLVELTRDQLLARVSSRSRFLEPAVDPLELLQDVVINIYRYPDRFDASRPGAFRAWSTTIVDNSVRRYLRKARSGPDVRLKPIEILAQEADELRRGPSELAILTEQCVEASRTFALFLAMYLQAYQGLSERERFVLHMVEVRGLRYAELGKIVGIRPEALKMVVFRARRRIAKQIEHRLAQSVSSMAG